MEIDDLSASQNGEKLVFTAKISGVQDPENLSVQLHYIFDSDAGSQRVWNYTFMEYRKESREWRATVEKKGETGTVYYYVTVLYQGEQYRYPQNGSKSFVYTPVIGFPPEVLCIVGFFILFIVFEVVMRYPLIKRRKREKEEGEAEEEPIEEGALTKCPSCGKIIPESVDACPYCGASMEGAGSENAQSKEITMGED